MLDLGMPTLLDTPTLEECAAMCRELGLQFIELNMNLPQYQPEQMDAALFQKIAVQYGIYYTIHLDENLNPCDFNPYIAKAYCQTVYDAISISKKLGVLILNMHLPRDVHFTLPQGKVYLFEVYKEQYLRKMCEFRDEAETKIGNSGIKLYIENSSGYMDFQVDSLALLLKSKAFGLTFDIGHNFCINGTDEPVILKYCDRLIHFHIHDAFEKKDHMALGTGTLNLRKYFSIAAEHHCRVVLETKSMEGLRASVQWIHQNIDG